MERSKVMETAKEVAGQLDRAQEMFRKDQSELCLAYMETIINPGPVYWFATCMLLCQGIVMETPECDCARRGEEQCFDVGVVDRCTMRPITDPLYPFSTEIITVFAKRDWEGFVDRLRHVAKSDRALPLACILLSRLTQLQDDRAAGRL
jgi:hypothetical protein